MKPQLNAKTCDKGLNCITCSGHNVVAMHGYVPKRKNDAKEGQRSNENEESVANNFADLKTLSILEKLQTKVISMCYVPMKVKSAAQRKDLLIYSTLYNCSQRSFIQEALAKKMKTSGKKTTNTTLNLKTLNGEVSKPTISKLMMFKYFCWLVQAA